MMMMMIIIMFIKLSLKFIQLVNQFKSPNLQERIIKKLKKKNLSSSLPATFQSLIDSG